MKEPHDLLVRDYLSAELDSQSGRAEMRFRQFLQNQSSSPVLPAARSRILRLPNRFGGWTMGLIGAGLAASLAALWAGPSLRQVAPPSTVAPK